MSVKLPVSVDVWRMVDAQSTFVGKLPLASLQRLSSSLVDVDGECEYTLQFGSDKIVGVSSLHLHVAALLPLECQRSLKRFLFPVEVTQILGLIRNISDEAKLPPDYEPFLVPENGQTRLSDIIEDELILSLPLVPMDDAVCVDRSLQPKFNQHVCKQQPPNQPHPFAQLEQLKKTLSRKNAKK